jgi:hypothetical protein
MLRLSVVVGVVSTLALAAPATAGSASFYDRNGSYAGSSRTSGSTTTFYDRRGSYAGTVTRTGRR